MAKKSNYRPPQPKAPKDTRRAPWWLWPINPVAAALHNATLPPLNPAGDPGSPTGGPAGAPGWGPPPGTPGAGGPGTTNLRGAAVPSDIAGRSGLQNAVLGTPAYTSQIPKFTPEQGAGFQSILRMALQGLGNTPMSFEPIAQKARMQFGEQTIPSIAERFTSMGGGGGRSSAFGQQLGAAGAGLESNLAAAEGQWGQQQLKLLQTLAALGLTPQFESQSYGRQPGAIENTAQSILSHLPTLAGLF